MIKRVRPVIIVVENTADVVRDVKKIIEGVNKGHYWEDYEIIVDIFQILTDDANKEPDFTYYKDVQFVPNIKSNNEQKTVDLNPLFEYLLRFEFLNNRSKFVQPIVLFAMDGSNNYSFDKEKYLRFKKSYIYSDSLRPLSFYCFGWIDRGHEQIIKALLNKGEEAEVFLSLAPYSSLTYAFWLMETMPKGETDVITRPEFPTDVVIKNGKICRVKTKSPKKVSKWLKELRKYMRY